MRTGTVLVGFLVAGLSLASTAVAAAQDLGDREVQTVARYERTVWNAWVDHNIAPLRQLLAPDYQIVTEEGIEAATSLDTIVENFDKYVVSDVKLDPIRGVRLAPGVVALNYRARVQSSYGNRDTSRDLAVVSIWVRRDGTWVSVFSHQVKVGPKPGA